MRIRTHDGVFHADEAMAVAIVQTFLNKQGLPRPEVVRTRREIDADIHIDVGMRYDSNTAFDHHQAGGAGHRPDSLVPYASAGLIWKYYGLELCKLTSSATETDRVAELMYGFVDEQLIRAIDAVDTGWSRQHMRQCLSAMNFSFSDLIKSLNELENGHDEAWNEALHICRVALMAALQSTFNQAIQGLATSKVIARTIEAKEDTVILPGYVAGWHKLVWSAAGNAVLHYAIFKADKGEKVQWMAEAIPVSASNPELRAPFPEGWSGRTPEEFRKITGVPDAIFCHANRFLCVAESFEGVKKLVSLAYDALPSL